ncbi:MAG: ATP-binding cassette domain-containing protein [Desulfobacterales bacterium]
MEKYQEPLLCLQNISKSFRGLQALSGVNLSLYPGEILGLVGDNGAGKSTLIKILAGLHPPDAGRMFLRGREMDFRTFTVSRARSLGIETVYQERSLGEKQPLWRNIFAGRHRRNRMGFICVREEKQAAMEILRNHVGLRGQGITADSPVQVLSGGERQGLAIGRAMYFHSDIIILDEPTTALSLREVGRVLDFIRAIPAANRSCIFISHNMNHVHRAADRIVLMDRGRIRREFRKQDLNIAELAAQVASLSEESEDFPIPAEEN